MRKCLIFLLCAAFCGTAAAQDLIVRRDAGVIRGKVLRTGGTKIQYTRQDDAAGPVHTLTTDEVLRIEYADGRVEEFRQAPATPKRIRAQYRDNYPHYQGEAAAGYGLGVGASLEGISTDRIVVETVHGVRLSPYAFIGAGVGLDYFHDKVADDTGAGVLTAFADARGYYPVSPGTSIYLALDLGAAVGMWNYMKDWRDLYFAAGPGVTLGSPQNRMRLDLGVRYQYLGEKTSAVLFRIGFNF